MFHNEWINTENDFGPHQSSINANFPGFKVFSYVNRKMISIIIKAHNYCCKALHLKMFAGILATLLRILMNILRQPKLQKQSPGGVPGKRCS